MGESKKCKFSVQFDSPIRLEFHGTKVTSDAADWKTVLDPIVEQYSNRTIHRYFRDDAAFANPGLYS